MIRPALSQAKKPRQLSRAERSERRRQTLFDAAARVVGRLGYADASIAEITRAAKVAQGTFYLYFETRQALLDQLLPVLGLDMVAFIRSKVIGVEDDLAREEARFRAFFDFLTERPEFYRILHEAEQLAPVGYRQHMSNMEQGYVRALRRARGKANDLDDFDLEVASYMMMAARDYLSMRYVFVNGRVKKVPEAVVRAYMRFVRGGLFGIRLKPAKDADDSRSAVVLSVDGQKGTP